MQSHNTIQVDYSSISIRNPGKVKCGDSSFSNAISINGVESILLIVADGVSSAPKDWLASQSAINCIVDYIQNHELSPSELLKQAILFSNKKIRSGIHNTTGMLTTLSVLMFIPDSKLLYYANIGDSRSMPNQIQYGNN